MYTAKCEICEVEVNFPDHRHWPEGWVQTGRSRWGKKYDKKSGYGWWCPKCQPFAGLQHDLQVWLTLLPPHLRNSISAHLPGLSKESEGAHP